MFNPSIIYFTPVTKYPDSITSFFGLEHIESEPL
jgi:hypothetical protein